ncbi:Hypothetical predicted protein [Marmota monax]|uniref:Uncharacterized protein n=1 Tax=Marmota monax TaxID=9995 RepID=A0A5E4C315_MARMO|nr:hypothetical protein GHT09_012996 [Marmota monax]VTJ76283.1 Hypothetical predicted protein [Marmota monax]
MHVGTWSEQRQSQAPVPFSGSALGPFATVLRKLKCLVLNVYTEERSLDFGSFPCSRCKSSSAGEFQPRAWAGDAVDRASWPAPSSAFSSPASWLLVRSPTFHPAHPCLDSEGSNRVLEASQP